MLVGKIAINLLKDGSCVYYADELFGSDSRLMQCFTGDIECVHLEWSLRRLAEAVQLRLILLGMDS